MNGHSGPCVQYDTVKEYPGLLRVYNMVGAHAILYYNKEYASLCKKIAYHGYLISDHQDIGFADVQRYYNVYAFDNLNVLLLSVVTELIIFILPKILFL